MQTASQFRPRPHSYLEFQYEVCSLFAGRTSGKSLLGSNSGHSLTHIGISLATKYLLLKNLPTLFPIFVSNTPHSAS